MITECRNMVKQNPCYSISFVRKQANRVAHLLARVQCEAFCFHDYLFPRHEVLESLLYDAVSI